MDKRRTLADAVEQLVPNGATLAVGGLSMNSAPMALVREIVRQGKKDLELVAIVAGMPVDWLVAGGCVRKVVSGLVSFEGLGLAPRFRAAVQAGEVEIEEYSEHTLICRLQAHAHRLPFVPTRAGIGTDMLALHADTTRLESDAATGGSYVACTPLPVDVALVHAHAADAAGNVRVDPKLIWMDNEVVNAAATTIVSVESIVPHRNFTAAPHLTTYPHFLVDAVVEAPWGAYPTSCFPIYSQDARFFAEYSAACRDEEAWERLWKERILGPETQGQFLDANGGARLLVDLARRTA